MRKLDRSFYNRNTLQVTRELLGKYLVHETNGEKLVGKIVEVEAYMGPEDKAAHSYGGRRTERVKVMYGESGHAYVFHIYGMYNCMNVVTERVGLPQAALIRALEPVEGREKMSLLRFGKSYGELGKREVSNLTNGPGKLCIAMNITRAQNGEDLCSDNLYLMEEDNEEPFKIVESKRINIDYAEEAKDFLWRFYIKDNKFISKK